MLKMLSTRPSCGQNEPCLIMTPYAQKSVLRFVSWRITPHSRHAGNRTKENKNKNKKTVRSSCEENEKSAAANHVEQV